MKFLMIVSSMVTAGILVWVACDAAFPNYMYELEGRHMFIGHNYKGIREGAKESADGMIAERDGDTFLIKNKNGSTCYLKFKTNGNIVTDFNMDGLCIRN